MGRDARFIIYGSNANAQMGNKRSFNDRQVPWQCDRGPTFPRVTTRKVFSFSSLLLSPPRKKRKARLICFLEGEGEGLSIEYRRLDGISFVPPRRCATQVKAALVARAFRDIRGAFIVLRRARVKTEPRDLQTRLYRRYRRHKGRQ